MPKRQITADDLERDRVLTQRIALFGWIEEAHLDIPVGEGSPGFLMFAQQGWLLATCHNSHRSHSAELLKVNHYKAPRDKLICILNCCKVIFGLPLPSPFSRAYRSSLLRLDTTLTKGRGSRLLCSDSNICSAQSEPRTSAIKCRVRTVSSSSSNGTDASIRFINRFRNPAKLQSEAGYYLSSLVGSSSSLPLRLSHIF